MRNSYLLNQNPKKCLNASACCGCDGDWKGLSCWTNVVSCGGDVCAGTAPVEVSSTCFEGSWVIYSTYRGPLTVNGSVDITGDYHLGEGEMLIFWGVESNLKVRGGTYLQESSMLYLDKESAEKVKKATVKIKGVQYIYRWEFLQSGFVEFSSTRTKELIARSSNHCFGSDTRYRYDSKLDVWWVELKATNFCGWVLPVAIATPIICLAIIALMIYLYRTESGCWARHIQDFIDNDYDDYGSSVPLLIQSN